jgi:hypothetical protein
MWGRIASCAAICNRRADRVKLGPQIQNLPHKNYGATAAAFSVK